MATNAESRWESGKWKNDRRNSLILNVRYDCECETTDNYTICILILQQDFILRSRLCGIERVANMKKCVSRRFFPTRCTSATIFDSDFVLDFLRRAKNNKKFASKNRSHGLQNQQKTYTEWARKQQFQFAGKRISDRPILSAVHR